MALPTSGIITSTDLSVETRQSFSDLNDDISHESRQFQVSLRRVSVADSTALKDRSTTFYVDDTCRVDLLGISTYSSSASSRTSVARLRAVDRSLTGRPEFMEDRELASMLTASATGWRHSRATHTDPAGELYYLRPGVLYELSVGYSDATGGDVVAAHLALSSRRRRR